MAAKRRNLSLPHAPLVNWKSFFVLVKTGRRFGNGAHAQAKQHARSCLGVPLKIAMQGAFALRLGYSVVRQRKVVHADFTVTGGLELFAGYLIQRARLAGSGNVWVRIASLSRLYTVQSVEDSRPV